MCKNKSCFCQNKDLVLLEVEFGNIWERIFTVREEAELEYNESHR